MKKNRDEEENNENTKANEQMVGNNAIFDSCAIDFVDETATGPKSDNESYKPPSRKDQLNPSSSFNNQGGDVSESCHFRTGRFRTSHFRAPNSKN